MPTSWSTPTQVTISLLPASLSLVHIPRSRLTQLSHSVLRQILQPNPTFLNITCNEIELSLFAEHHTLEDFELIARRDRQRQRSRSGSGSSHKSITSNHLEPVEISYEKWNVLQIDSHSDQIDSSGARVNDLSAPLAAAGISILYQSSYMSDFIFVKETRLQEVMSLFASAGFDLYSSDPNSMTQTMSPTLSPMPDDLSSIIDMSSSTPSGAVLTRARGSIDTSPPSGTSLVEDLLTKESEELPSGETLLTRQAPPRNKSHSRTSGEVCALSPDLACVGLSDDSADIWGLKIVKLVAFPDLIPSSCNASRSSVGITKISYFSDYTTSQVQTPLFESLFHDSSPMVRGGTPSISDSSSSSGDEDGYFSHSPDGNQSTSSLVTSSSRSCSDLTKPTTMSSPFKPPSKHLITPLPPLSVITPTLNSARSVPSRSDIASDPPTSSSQSSRSSVPFFSFTRTTEGSSLTTDVSLLATLFPPHERYMVICSGELDVADDRSANGFDLSDDEDEDRTNSQGSTLKCLQIDLRRFGLDKHGLVNRFSRVLEENNINHMYSSTFKTANLLVDKRHAVRAQALLRAC